jgi:hypothetical protein
MVYIAVSSSRTSVTRFILSIETYIVVDPALGVWWPTFFLRFKHSKQAFDLGTPTIFGNPTIHSQSQRLGPVREHCCLGEQWKCSTKREVCHAEVIYACFLGPVMDSAGGNIGTCECDALSFRPVSRKVRQRQNQPSRFGQEISQ